MSKVAQYSTKLTFTDSNYNGSHVRSRAYDCNGLFVPLRSAYTFIGRFGSGVVGYGFDLISTFQLSTVITQMLFYRSFTAIYLLTTRI